VISRAVNGIVMRVGLVSLAAGLALAGCSNNTPQLVQGDCHDMNGANVCVWGETTGKTLTSFGATIPLAAISNAPDSVPMVWPPVADVTLPLPAEVTSATGFTAATFYWEPDGHPPAPYLTPHFDFHFYTIPVAAIDSITCADTTKPAELPTGYELPDVAIPGMGTLVGLCVPKMGMHSLLASEANGSSLFQHDIIIGYDHQHPIFVEPMISKATLMAQQTFSDEVPTVPNGQAGVHYPTHFEATWDSTAKAYKFTFTGFTAPQ
jgi:hypothetical protein